MNTDPEVWAIVELMGHVRMAGRLTEEEKFGTKMGRLDIPIPNDSDDMTIPQFVTQLFGGSSVYRITIVSEDVARDVAKRSQPAPVSPWDYPKQLGHTPTESASRICPDCGRTVEECECEEENDDDRPF